MNRLENLLKNLPVALLHVLETAVASTTEFLTAYSESVNLLSLALISFLALDNMCIFMSLLDLLKNTAFALLYDRHELYSGQPVPNKLLCSSFVPFPARRSRTPSTLQRHSPLQNGTDPGSWENNIQGKRNKPKTTHSQTILRLLCFVVMRVHVIWTSKSCSQ